MILDILKHIIQQHPLSIAERLACQHEIKVPIGHTVFLHTSRNQTLCLLQLLTPWIEFFVDVDPHFSHYAL
jgi:hypothetical protein